jgi:hypothetical protein
MMMKLYKQTLFQLHDIREVFSNHLDSPSRN